MTPVDLPAGLAEPLRYLSPAWMWVPLYVLLAAATAALLWWLRRRTRLAAESRAGSGTPTPSPRPGPGGMLEQIQALRQQVLEHADYRLGCHELARLLREHVYRRRGKRLFTLTAREIGERIEDQGLASLFSLVAELQFRRAEPSRDDFEGICDIASDSAGGRVG